MLFDKFHDFLFFLPFFNHLLFEDVIFSSFLCLNCLNIFLLFLFFVIVFIIFPIIIFSISIYTVTLDPFSILIDISTISGNFDLRPLFAFLFKVFFTVLLFFTRFLICVLVCRTLLCFCSLGFSLHYLCLVILLILERLSNGRLVT